jgi:hypothetical protein
MATEMGEYIVGAYLRLILECDVVDYNARPPGGGLQGLGELDVIGFSFGKRIAYLCEVTTHLDGLQIGASGAATIQKLTEKHARQRAYADQYLRGFEHHLLWSPCVRSGLVYELQQIASLELVINGEYKNAIDMLRTKARASTADANNPAFRVLQILEHLRDSRPTPESSERIFKSADRTAH